MESKGSSRSKVTRQGGGGQRSIAAASRAPCDFLLSGFREEQVKKDLMTKIRALGGNNAETFFSKCTHVISCKPIRSEKFLCGVASGKWILKPDFITVSSAKGKWQPESKYEWSESDVVSENVLPGLLKAPKRWREKVGSSGRGAFHGWKVFLHVKNHKNRALAVYRRVLEAGGGQCVSVNLPIKNPARLASLLTHVIVDKCFEKDIECLDERDIPCLLPEFIAEHLFQETPNMAQYHVSNTLMTPTTAIRQSNVVVSSVSAKKDHARGTPKIDNFLKPTPRTRSQGKQTNLQDSKRDTPGSTTTSDLEESSSSDTGRGVKRKLHFSPNQLREALQILKKRKLSSQHLPLVPYTMTIPRPKKTFQCASDDCPSRPFPANTCSSIEANIEESHWLDALACIGSSISTHYYPPPHILYSTMQHILLSSSLTECRTAVHILKQVLCLHSPACYASLRGLYFDSMVPPPGLFKIAYHNEHWELLDAVIRRALDGQRVIQDVKEHEDEEAVKVAMETGEMLLHFLVSLFEEDYMASARRTDDRTETRTGPTKCILAKILWPSCMEQASRKVPINVHMLMNRFIQAVKMAAKCDDWVPVTSLMSTLMLLAAEIHVAFGELPGNKNKNPEKGRREFAEKLASRVKQEGILGTRSCQEMFLSMLKPSWLCMGVAECLLHNCDDQLLGGDRTFWVDQPLSLKKIVSYYFYLVPPTTGPVRKDDPGECKSIPIPLKTISNQQPMCKKGTSLSKPSPRKSQVNRKNHKGETQLHTACIKNNVSRVRELLNEPNIDVNATDHAGWTPLHEACNHGHIPCVKELLKFAPGKRKSIENKSVQPLNLLAAPSECGTTPLHDAVNNHQIEVVKLLVEAGGRSLLTVKNKAGATPVNLAQTEVMKKAILGQRSEVSRLPAVVEKESENKLNSPQPHPSKYRQFLGPPSTSTAGYVTEEECEAFMGIVMAMLQSYIRSHDLHRVKAEVDIIKGQRRHVNILQMNGVNANISETTPFVSVVGSPTFSKAGLPLAPNLQGPVYTGTGSDMGSLLEDMEVFMELSRHTEGFKAHIRQIGPDQETTTTTASTKAPITIRVTRSMRLITHLCAVVS